MARPAPSTWLPLLDRALEQEIGIAVPISGISREQMQAYLYTARKDSGDPRYSDLIIFRPGGDYTDELWICNKEVELDDASPK